MGMKYMKSAARLLDRYCVNRKGLDLSKEVLWVSVGQRAAALLAVKVGGSQEKSTAQPQPHSNQLARIRIRPSTNHSQSPPKRFQDSIKWRFDKFSKLNPIQSHGFF